MRPVAVIELDDAIGHIEVSVVVGDHQHGFAAGFELGQQLGIENILKVRVLVGRPFVEEVKGPVFEVSRQQGQPLALALGDGGGGEDAVLDFDFVVQVQLVEVLASACSSRLAVFEPEQVFEEVKIAKHGREELAVIVPVPIGDEFAVQPDFAGFGRVKPGDDLGQGGFAAAVAADEEHQFAAAEAEVNRTEHEMAVVLLAVVGMSHAFEFQSLEVDLIRHRPDSKEQSSVECCARETPSFSTFWSATSAGRTVKCCS